MTEHERLVKLIQETKYVGMVTHYYLTKEWAEQLATAILKDFISKAGLLEKIENLGQQANFKICYKTVGKIKKIIEEVK